MENEIKPKHKSYHGDSKENILNNGKCPLFLGDTVAGSVLISSFRKHYNFLMAYRILSSLLLLPALLSFQMISAIFFSNRKVMKPSRFLPSFVWLFIPYKWLF